MRSVGLQQRIEESARHSSEYYGLLDNFDEQVYYLDLQPSLVYECRFSANLCHEL
jgi:hypothetical protein